MNLIVKRDTLNKVMELYGKNMLILQNNQVKETNKTVKKVTNKLYSNFTKIFTVKCTKTSVIKKT